jgi:hypothetical protein
MKKLFLLFSLFSLTGCQYLSVERKTYHNLNSETFTGKSFQIILLDPAQRDSLEFSSHSNVLASILKSKGMIEAKLTTKSDYIVAFDFKISGSTQIGSTSTPHFTTSGGTSNFNATTYGNGGSYNTYGTVSSYPTLKYAGSTTEEYSYTEYSRDLTIKIYNQERYNSGDKKPIYETQAFSSGPSRETSKIVPLLIKSLMTNFPLPSGSSDRTNILWE